MPVEGATVVARPVEESFVFESAAVSDANGRFVLHEILPGTNALIVHVPECGTLVPASPWDRFTANPGEATRNAEVVVEVPAVDFDPLATLSISGRVRESNGEAANDVLVHASSGQTFRTVLSDKNGSYEIDRLPPGLCGLKFKRDGRLRLTCDFVEAGTRGFDVELPSFGSVDGLVVVASSGEALREFDMSFVDESMPYVSPAGPNWRRFRSETGSFRVDGVQPGSATLTFRAEGFVDSSVEVARVEPGETTSGVIVRMGTGANVAGIVLDSRGHALADVGVFPGKAPRFDAPETVIVARSAEDGTFRLWDIPLDTDTITAYHPEFAIAALPVKSVAGRETTVKFVLTTGGIVEGFVYRGDEPWPGLRVRLHAGRAEAGTSGMGAVESVTSESGAYHFEKVRAGRAGLSLYVADSGDVFRMQHKTIDVAEGLVTTADFHFDPSDSRLEGTVTLDEVPLSDPRARVVLTYRLADGYEQHDVKVRTDGTFVFPMVPEGDAEMAVHSDLLENAPAGLPVTIAGPIVTQDVRLPMEPASSGGG